MAMSVHRLRLLATLGNDFHLERSHRSAIRTKAARSGPASLRNRPRFVAYRALSQRKKEFTIVGHLASIRSSIKAASSMARSTKNPFAIFGLFVSKSMSLRPSRPGEFHPGSLTDPDVNLSIHPARAIQRRLPPSIKTRSSSGCPLTPSRCGWPAPFAPRALLRFIALTEQCAPDRCLGTFGLMGSPLVPFPLPSPTRFSSSVRKPGYESCLLYAGHRMASK